MFTDIIQLYYQIVHSIVINEERVTLKNSEKTSLHIIAYNKTVHKDNTVHSSTILLGMILLGLQTRHQDVFSGLGRKSSRHSLRITRRP